MRKPHIKGISLKNHVQFLIFLNIEEENRDRDGMNINLILKLVLSISR